VDERRSWPLAQAQAELEQGYGSAADAMTAVQASWTAWRSASGFTFSSG
jgi:hypothetical protein